MKRILHFGGYFCRLLRVDDTEVGLVLSNECIDAEDAKC
jgi:hypothetical protein